MEREGREVENEEGERVKRGRKICVHMCTRTYIGDEAEGVNPSDRSVADMAVCV